jgi:hypothetical protein
MDTAQPRFTYDVGGARFMIYPSAGVASGSHNQLGFLVGDLAWPVSQLRQDGITFDDHAGPDGIADFEPVQAAWFKASEGNLRRQSVIAAHEPAGYQRSRPRSSASSRACPDLSRRRGSGRTSR